MHLLPTTPYLVVCHCGSLRARGIIWRRSWGRRPRLIAPRGGTARLNNGHNWLAAQLSRRHIGYRLLDNAFVETADWRRAQRLADRWRVQQIHKRLDPFARRFGPISGSFQQHYHCSINQAEYASAIVLRRQAELGAIYENLSRSAIHAVKPDNIATFLGRQTARQLPGRDGQPLPHSHRSEVPQTHPRSTPWERCR